MDAGEQGDTERIGLERQLISINKIQVRDGLKGPSNWREIEREREEIQVS
jgi:hypothetical protein